jgi:hypothetical protein
MILTKIWLCLSHGTVGCSKNKVGFGAGFVGKSAISKSAFMKIRGNQNSIGIVDLISPLCIMTGRRRPVNIPLDIGDRARPGMAFSLSTDAAVINALCGIEHHHLRAECLAMAKRSESPDVQARWLAMAQTWSKRAGNGDEAQPSTSYG